MTSIERLESRHQCFFERSKHLNESHKRRKCCQAPLLCSPTAARQTCIAGLEHGAGHSQSKSTDTHVAHTDQETNSIVQLYQVSDCYISWLCYVGSSHDNIHMLTTATPVHAPSLP